MKRCCHGGVSAVSERQSQLDAFIDDESRPHSGPCAELQTIPALQCIDVIDINIGESRRAVSLAIRSI